MRREGYTQGGPKCKNPRSLRSITTSTFLDLLPLFIYLFAKSRGGVSDFAHAGTGGWSKISRASLLV